MVLDAFGECLRNSEVDGEVGRFVRTHAAHKERLEGHENLIRCRILLALCWKTSRRFL